MAAGRGQAKLDERPGREVGRPRPEEHQRRQPEQTALHRAVREHLEDFLQAAQDEGGKRLPRFIERALRAYLACGIPSAGFTRLACQRCGHEAILAFICKTRLLCPSCAGRQMDDGTAHLVDEVLPGDIPYRHIVVSLPFEIRGLLAFRPEVLNAAIRLINDSVLCWQKKRSSLGPGAKVGGLSVLQRAGSSLNVNPQDGPGCSRQSGACGGRALLARPC